MVMIGKPQLFFFITEKCVHVYTSKLNRESQQRSFWWKSQTLQNVSTGMTAKLFCREENLHKDFGFGLESSLFAFPTSVLQFLTGISSWLTNVPLKKESLMPPGEIGREKEAQINWRSRDEVCLESV